MPFSNPTARSCPFFSLRKAAKHFDTGSTASMTIMTWDMRPAKLLEKRELLEFRYLAAHLRKARSSILQLTIWRTMSAVSPSTEIADEDHFLTSRISIRDSIGSLDC